MIGCCITTFSDIKFGKIHNKIVILYGSIPVALNLIKMFVAGGWLDYSVNALIVIIIAILLYYFRVWAGGDCKMMIFIALSTPIELYWNASRPGYTFWYVYIFIFSIGFLYLCVDNIRMIFVKKYSLIDKKFMYEFKTRVYVYIRTLVYLSAISNIYINIIHPYIETSKALFTLICIIIIALVNKIRILKNKYLIALIAVLDLVCIFVSGNITINTLWYVYVIVFVLMAIRSVSNIFNYEDLKTSSVEAGMIVSQETSILFQRSKVQSLPGISDETLKSRITKEEAEAIKRWEKSKYGLDSIRIVRKMPFAIFITVGLVSYFILGWFCFDY